ncbi:ATP phosphoribosyltransferase [Roseibium denhamense]|uniref:ATP phosphoribosyltransferase n=1 Tax=Roseibium denhamense TaxID=76305 RepID=A0ABY1P3Y2_9HYPH|nr:ATP phosphoribosyltransferase [Roseibium denhamense]MTI07653.1 ATP phosphoribosyltransferase [Roseibium denhamense]SMP24368.1 ATP phosphoribosyltransferase (homohexameric) /ATP phosphoribosyltransferase catalytic subunit /ATP phosphoribosyltransferase regulatory subunit [Roseibium denhamense]
MSKLIIAIPSKGRLQDNTHEFFGQAGLKVLQPGGARNYRGAIKGLETVEIAFLSASEIARALSNGEVHFGITGLDLVHENITDPENTVHIVTPLGFGPADVVVAVPKAWIDVETMADLSDVASDFRGRHGRRLRVATKYVNLTRAFFARYGIADYRIVESAGATEGAPAAGSAELIVDITTTGSTLQANNLKILSDGVMLKSQAHLVASLNADWSETALSGARSILDRVAAEETARDVKLVKAIVDDRTQALRAVSRLGAVQRFSESDDKRRVNVLCPKDAIADCAQILISEGADTVTVEALDYVFSKENRLFAPLKAKVAG